MKEEIIKILRKYSDFDEDDHKESQEFNSMTGDFEKLINVEVEKRIAERMPSEKVDAIIERINEDVEKPMVTAQFGDMWKSHAIEHYNLPDIVNIAWRQGRRALLLEKELRSRLTNLRTRSGCI